MLSREMFLEQELLLLNSIKSDHSAWLEDVHIDAASSIGDTVAESTITTQRPPW